MLHFQELRQLISELMFYSVLKGIEFFNIL